MDKSEQKLPHMIESFAFKRYKINPVQLRDHGRTYKVVRVRFIVWRALYEFSGMSYPKIGKLYTRDHTTVLHGVWKTFTNEGLSKEYADFIAHYKALCDMGVRSGQTVENLIKTGDRMGI